MFRWTRATIVTVGLLLILGVPLAPRAQTPSEVDQLKATVQAMQQSLQELRRELDARNANVEALTKTVDSLNGRIAELEGKPSPQSPPQAGPQAVPAVTPAALGSAAPRPHAGAPGDEVATPYPAYRNWVPEYQNFADHQSAAPRPEAAQLVPSREGFIPVPGTALGLKFDATARVDAIENFGNAGNPNEFIPSSMPVQGQSGYGGPDQFGMEAKGSRLSLDMRHWGPEGSDYRLYYENDFFNDSTSSAMSYRLRHLYGQWRNFLIGQTFTGFSNPDAFPDTVDYENVNAVVNLRQPQVRLIVPVTSHQHLTLSFEQPTSQIDTSAAGFAPGAFATTPWPDFTVNYRYEGKAGHLQMSLLARDIAYDAPTGGQSVFGWGASLSGVLHLSRRENWLDFQLAYGEGMARYIKDAAGQNLDAALDEYGRLEAIPVFAPMIGFTHEWSERWRTTATYGYVRVDAPATLGGSALRNTQYASLNVMWHAPFRAWLGLEYLWGEKETQDGAKGTANRLNFVVKYSFGK
jgi:hypothetical protein